MTTQDFLDAARLGVHSQTEAGLKADSSLAHTAGGEGRTALHLAAYSGHREIARRLLDAGADVNRQDKADRSPLVSMVSWRTRRDLVGLLLERGAEIEAYDHSGNSALYVAAACIRRDGHAWGDHAGLVSFLLERGAALDLFTAAILNRHEDAVRLLDADPALVYRKDREVMTVDGATPLILALWYGQKEIARFLVGHGANINALDGWASEPWIVSALSE